MAKEPVLNLKNPNLPIWSDNLKPKGEGSGRFDKEPFSDWWQRHCAQLANLEPRIAEQWVYRHWYHSHFKSLPLRKLSWRMITLESAEIIRDIIRYGHENIPYNPEHDYEVFQRSGGADRHATAMALDNGTWDYPIVALETPDGFVDAQRDRPEARFVLIEGHQRMRYLNALLVRQHTPLGPHEVFVLTCSVKF